MLTSAVSILSDPSPSYFQTAQWQRWGNLFLLLTLNIGILYLIITTKKGR